MVDERLIRRRVGSTEPMRDEDCRSLRIVALAAGHGGRGCPDRFVDPDGQRCAGPRIGDRPGGDTTGSITPPVRRPAAVRVASVVPLEGQSPCPVGLRGPSRSRRARQGIGLVRVAWSCFCPSRADSVQPVDEIAVHLVTVGLVEHLVAGARVVPTRDVETGSLADAARAREPAPRSRKQDRQSPVSRRTGMHASGCARSRQAP